MMYAGKKYGEEMASGLIEMTERSERKVKLDGIQPRQLQCSKIGI